MDYVSEEAATMAKSFETRLRKLSPDAGILFVGLKAVPWKDGKSKVFEVYLGTVRGVGESAGTALVRFTFKEEIEKGLKFLVTVHQGVPGAARGNNGDA